MEIQRIAEAAAFSPEKAAKTLLSTGEHARVTLWCLEIGQEIHPHTHAGDHVWVVQEGSGWYLSGSEETKVEPGCVVFAPEGELHGMRAETKMVFVSVSAGSH